MTEQEPETVRVYWIPDTDQGPVDLSPLTKPQPMEPAPQADTGAAYKYEFVNEVVDAPPIPEGTLTKVIDDQTGELIGHAEVIYDDDGAPTFKIYGLTHNSEEQP